MSFVNRLIDMQLKLKQYKIQFLFLFLVWFSGFLYFFLTEPIRDMWNIFLCSFTVRISSHSTDFSNFYALVWPILLEVIVFGFIMGELFEKFNPTVTSKILAGHQRNHTLIIGHHHLAERIIEHCVKHKKKFCILEDDQELVEDLISAGHPVVIGDPTQQTNLEFSSVHRAKEVFICINNIITTIICTELIRKLNPDCPIYARVFEDHNREFLEQEQLHVFTFSTSAWAMDGIKEWTEGKTGDAIIIGRDHLTHRIAHHISTQDGRKAYLFDDEHDGIEFQENEQLCIRNEFACFLSDIRPHVDLNKVTQAFICWKRETELDESIYLTSKLHLRYPHIEVFVRIFDEEIAKLIKKYNGKPFSSSSIAFDLLQKQVPKNSSIYVESEQ